MIGDVNAAAAYVLHMQEQRERSRRIVDQSNNSLVAFLFNPNRPITPFEGLNERTKRYWRRIASGMSADEAHTFHEQEERRDYDRPL